MVITDQGNLHCLDGIKSHDRMHCTSAKTTHEMHDPSKDDERELEQLNGSLTTIALDWQISAALLMCRPLQCTMDIVATATVAAHNFLDVGGGATKRRVTDAFKIHFVRPKRKAVLSISSRHRVRCGHDRWRLIGAVGWRSVYTFLLWTRLEGQYAELGRKC